MKVYPKSAEYEIRPDGVGGWLLTLPHGLEVAYTDEAIKSNYVFIDEEPPAAPQPPPKSKSKGDHR